MASLYLAAFGVTAAIALDNGITAPPMGWSALYGAPFGKVNETILMRAADGLKASGLLSKGYEFVTIDDWWATRDENGDIIGLPKTFPSGMKAVADHVHSQGCKFGVYSAAGERTCANFSASLFNEVRDANTMAGWGVDFLKYDACRYSAGVGSRARYQAMGRALNATGRPFVYSVEGWSPAQGYWGPEVANMWRTGSDIWPKWDVCVLNNLYQTNIAAPYNRYSMMASGTLKNHHSGGFNDGDMLQPPNTLISCSTPGLTTAEAMSQFKLWVIMKAPLVLGVNWSQLANLAKLAPDYFALISNEEMIGINQDPSPQGVLAAAYPSKSQQTNNTGLNVTMQQCDPGRPDQRFVPHPAGGIVLAGTDLCLTLAGNANFAADALGDKAQSVTTVMVKPCTAVKDVFTLAQDEQLTIVTATGGSVGSGLCLTSQPIADETPSETAFGGVNPVLTATKCVDTTPINHHSKTDPLPLPIAVQSVVGEQTFVWGTKDQQVVSAGSGRCLTAGNPNMYPHHGNTYGDYTNALTLEHEVWIGPLTDNAKTGGKRWVVALFNKGADTEALTASSELIGNAQKTFSVRDVLAQKALAPLAPGAALTANVASHDTAVFIVEVAST